MGVLWGVSLSHKLVGFLLGPCTSMRRDLETKRHLGGMKLHLISARPTCSLLPNSVATLSTETLPLLAVTFITENSLVAAVSDP